MTKQRVVLYLTPETEFALKDYARRHPRRFRSPSAAAEHLLTRALHSSIDEGTEAGLVPQIEAAVRAAVPATLRQELDTKLERQSNRLAALLAKTANQAGAARHLTRAVLEEVINFGTPEDDDGSTARREATALDKEAYAHAVADLKMRG